MNFDSLQEAKRRLSLTPLMAQLGYGEHAKKSARCPFHPDTSASFSVFTGNDGFEHWKCFAGCGQGDAIDFLARVRNLSNADACREFLTMAGVTAQPTAAAPVHQPAPSWSACLAAFTPGHAAKLAEWRGYSVEFVTWLHSSQLVGLHEGRIAFPVHGPGGAVISIHYRLKEDGSWRYDPPGKRTQPLVLGAPASSPKIFAFESQWDAWAVLDKLSWHTGGLPDTAVVITRCAENGKLLAGLCSPDSTVYAFTQNDPARPDGKRTSAETCVRSSRSAARSKTRTPAWNTPSRA